MQQLQLAWWNMNIKQNWPHGVGLDANGNWRGSANMDGVVLQTCGKASANDAWCELGKAMAGEVPWSDHIDLIVQGVRRLNLAGVADPMLTNPDAINSAPRPGAPDPLDVLTEQLKDLRQLQWAIDGVEQDCIAPLQADDRAKVAVASALYAQLLDILTQARTRLFGLELATGVVKWNFRLMVAATGTPYFDVDVERLASPTDIDDDDWIRVMIARHTCSQPTDPTSTYWPLLGSTLDVAPDETVNAADLLAALAGYPVDRGPIRLVMH